MSPTLVLTVGTGRKGSDIAEAIVFSIQKHTPETVIFLCSAVTQSKTMPFVREALADFTGKTEESVCADENNVQQLYREYLSVLRNHEHVIVDFTSGTKAMSAALFAAGVAVQADQVSYVVGPRDDTGRVIHSEEVIAFHPAEVLAERQLDRARVLFNNRDFHGAVVLAEPLKRTLPQDSPNGLLARTITLIGQAYNEWDHYQWKLAGNKLKKAAGDHEPLMDTIDKTQLAANAKFVRSCQKEEYGSARLVDIWLNAQRRFNAARYDDALARLYRLIEYIIQCRFMNLFGFGTSKLTAVNLKSLQLSEPTRNRYAKREKDTGGTFNVGLREAMELLAEHGDLPGIKLINHYWNPGTWQPNKKMKPKQSGPLQSWLNQRNESLLAHGTKPVEPDTVKKLLNLCKEMLTLEEMAVDFDGLKQQAKFITL